MGIDSKSLVFSPSAWDPYREVTGRMRQGPFEGSDIKDTDGLIARSIGVTLTTFYADCVPLYFLDPVKRAAGLTHAGWKGTVAGIALETVKRMNEAFGSRPEDMLVGIGPSICRDCYEVDEPVISRLRENIQSWRDVITPLGKDRYLLDLQLTNRIVLQKAGIRYANITDSGLCTMCNEELFYSYRREGKDTGSLAALLQLL